MPRCFHVTGADEGPDVVWMEHIVDFGSEPWSSRDFGDAAFVLGRFNATSLQRDWPPWPWLDGRNQTRDFVDRFVAERNEVVAVTDLWKERFRLDDDTARRLLDLHAIEPGTSIPSIGFRSASVTATPTTVTCRYSGARTASR